MTQADKDLLLKDLCARLPYGVKCEIDGERKVGTLFQINACSVSINEDCFDHLVINCKPYLFPISSMTDGQIYQSPFGYATMDAIRQDDIWSTITIGCKEYYDIVDWLNKNHFDYRGLIPMGLAEDATGKNIY